MQNKHTIHHDARIVCIDGNRVELQMMQQSACASCDAAGLCHSHESKMRTLVVNVPDGSAFKEGDQVWLHTEVRLGMQASVLAYVVPLFMVVAVLAGCSMAGVSEGISAVASLLVLAVYFAGLYAMRGRLSRKFEIKITNIQH